MPPDTRNRDSLLRQPERATVERHEEGEKSPCRFQWCCGCNVHPIGKPWGWNSEAWSAHYLTAHPDLMSDGMTKYISGVNCIDCGRFVGRDGSISVEHFEMSSEISSVDGQCRRCIDAA